MDMNEEASAIYSAKMKACAARIQLAYVAASQKLDREMAPIKQAMRAAYEPGSGVSVADRDKLIRAWATLERRFDIACEKAAKAEWPAELAAHWEYIAAIRGEPPLPTKDKQLSLWEAV
jgi:hypothetical protein